MRIQLTAPLARNRNSFLLQLKIMTLKAFFSWLKFLKRRQRGTFSLWYNVVWYVNCAKLSIVSSFIEISQGKTLIPLHGLLAFPLWFLEGNFKFAPSLKTFSHIFLHTIINLMSFLWNSAIRYSKASSKMENNGTKVMEITPQVQSLIEKDFFVLITLIFHSMQTM